MRNSLDPTVTLMAMIKRIADIIRILWKVLTVDCRQPVLNISFQAQCSYKLFSIR